MKGGRSFYEMEKGKTIVGSCVSRRLNFLIIDDLRGTKSSISFYRTNELAAGSKSEDREKASRDSAIRSGKGAVTGEGGNRST